MRRRVIDRRKVAAISVAVLTSVLPFGPQAQAETPGPLVPEPYRHCMTLSGSTCRAEATALTDGTADAQASLVSPAGGTLPERSGDALALAAFKIPFTVRRAVFQIPVNVTVRVNAASTTWTSATETSGPGYGRVLLQAFLSDVPAPGCFCLQASGAPDVVLSEVTSPGTGSSVEDQNVTLSFVVQNSDGTRLPRGDYRILVRPYALARLGDGTLVGAARGEIGAFLDAHLSDVTIG